jgi:glycolate oxidase FAD binding subunit
MPDETRTLQQQVQAAYADGTPLRIRGGGSKDFYGLPAAGMLLDTGAHTGIIKYEPGELVLTARSGTPLAAIEAELAGHGQMLGCEPPYFGGHPTFGGMIAAGLSGPRRPYSGSVADQVLGCRILNGKGELLTFGGRVMKNVAGYDVTRLLAGSLGCLGVILEATIKLSPRPAAERSFRVVLEADAATIFVNTLTGRGYPVSAASHYRGLLTLRFSAGAGEIDGLDGRLRREFAGHVIEEEHDADFWPGLRDQRLPFFADTGVLWRLSLAAAARIDIPGDTCRDWNGALRWLRTAAPPDAIFNAMSRVRGSATVFRAGQAAAAAPRFQPLPPALRHWHRQIKLAFDPRGILNHGRMYQEF